MKYHTPYLLFCSVLLLCLSCKKDSDNNHDSDIDSRLHIVGREDYIATYWHAGNVYRLGKSQVSSDANSLFISGNDVYIVGYEMSLTGKYTAMLWKNNLPNSLTDGNEDAMANGVAVVNSDVYVVGQRKLPNNDNWIATLWKNGEPISLSDPTTTNANAYDIAVVGTDVYVIGESRILSDLSSKHVYWKNGELSYLSNNEVGSGNQSITSSGNQVYMMWCGAYNSFGDSRVYYKDLVGSAKLLTDSPDDTRGEDIKVNGTDIYIAGWISNAQKNLQAAYWKNGNQTLVGPENASSFGMAIALSGNNIFVAGYVSVADKRSRAVYWKNGDITYLSDGQYDALVRRIWITQ